MSRIRVTFIISGLVVLAVLAFDSHAQGPGGQGRGGRGGRGGPGGIGRGGPGGFGGSLITLANNEAVQKELKMTDRQKGLVKRISDELNQKRRDMFQNMRRQTEAAKAQANVRPQQVPQQIDPSIDARGSGAGDPLIAALNNRGYTPPIYGGQPLVDPSQAARAQQGPDPRAFMAQNFAMMRQGMTALDNESEQALGQILERGQRERLKQIQLQIDAPFSVLRPEVAQTLDLTEEQVEQIQEVQQLSNNARREAFAQNRQLFTAFRGQGRGNGPGANGAAGAGNDNGAGANGPGATGGTGNARRGNRNPNGGNVAGGVQGGANAQGGPGQGRRFDPEAMRKFMEQPEVKSAMEQTRKQQELIKKQSTARINKILDRRQAVAFKKMLGPPFDVESLQASMFRGPGGPRNGGPGGPGQNAPSATTDASKSSAEAKAAPSNNTEPSAKSSTGTRKRSLRERRGLGPQDQN